MWYRLSITVLAALIVSRTGVAAAELPTYEIAGFPATPHQMTVLEAAGVEERAGAPIPTVAGAPFSPHQIAVMTQHQKSNSETTRGSSTRASTARARLPVVAIPH